MKKARLLLTAITVLAVVGGAFAFKAHKFTSDKIFTPDANGICNVQVNGKTITNVGVVKVSATDVALTTTCDLTYTKVGL